MARATDGVVVLRVEDHDRQRCRPEFEAGLLDDLEALGFEPDEPSITEFRPGSPSDYRQSDNGPVYEAAAAGLAERGLVYACDCSRTTFATWASTSGRPWRGPGCPGACAVRGLDREVTGLTLRVALGGGDEAWSDLALGPRPGPVAGAGDMPIRDRHGNWTYSFCVVVDDLRHGIDLVIRGQDLIDATPSQIRLRRLLGRPDAPRFIHHPLIRRPDGRKLSKADGATGVRELLASGATVDQVKSSAATRIGWTANRGESVP